MKAIVTVEQSKILQLRLEAVRPFNGQPRDDFDFDRLTDLADSISEFGQQVAVIVRQLPEPDGAAEYELIDGERRWRACKIAGVETIRAEVRGARNDDHQFAQSVVANFGREDHTELETIKAVARVYGMPEHAALPQMKRYDRVGALFARSGMWAQQKLRMWSLPDEVLELIGGPKERRLNSQVALMLSAVHDPKEQIRLAREIVDKQMKPPAARLLVRSAVGRRDGDGVRNRPARDVDQLMSTVITIRQKADYILGMPAKGVRVSLDGRSGMREALSRRIDEAIAALRQLKQSISRE